MSFSALGWGRSAPEAWLQAQPLLSTRSVGDSSGKWGFREMIKPAASLWKVMFETGLYDNARVLLNVPRRKMLLTFY